MRNPDRHEQPAEGGAEIIERALQKQSDNEAKPDRPKPKSTPKERKKETR